MPVVVTLAVVAACAALAFPAAAGADPEAPRALVLTAKPGVAPDVVGATVEALRGAGASAGVEVEVSADPAALARLGGYRALVFAHSTGDVLTAAQAEAVRAFLGSGGGVLSLGAAAGLEPGSAFFNGVLGARPAGEPVLEPRLLEAGDRVHPATRELPVIWGPHAEPWRVWAQNPTGQVHTLLRARLDPRHTDDAARPGSTTVPVAWCRDYGGGRTAYTALGSTTESFESDDARAHLSGLLGWVTGTVRGNCKATIASSYHYTRLTNPNAPGRLDQTGEPHGLAIAPNGWVVYIGRAVGADEPVGDWGDPRVGLGTGTIHIWDPEAPGSDPDRVTLAGTLPVFGHLGDGPDEVEKSNEGLLGIALAPDFMETGHIYLYWTPHETVDRQSRTAMRRVSRFTLDLDEKRLDPESEVVILEWSVQIHSCCHAGGGMGFDSEGNLYVATGDNMSAQAAITPNLPQRTFGGRPYADARATAGNTNDLNGKLLRIRPLPVPEGASPEPGVGRTYEIPTGPNGPNLFTGAAVESGLARPEIYAMGLRNPTRLAIDPLTDRVHISWVGAAAFQPNANWGPEKLESLAVVRGPANFGWPFCVGAGLPYRGRAPGGQALDETAPGYVAGWYDCDRLRNDSPHNTGLDELPPASPADIWYGPGQGNGCGVYPVSEAGMPDYRIEARTQLCPWAWGGSQAVMGGPVYRYRPGSPPTAWPEYWDGRWLMSDFHPDNLRHAVLMDPDVPPGSQPLHAESLKEIVPRILGQMAWEFGPDGALYVLTYGATSYRINADAGLHRITYVGGPPTPVPEARWEPAPALGAVRFSAEGSGGVAWRWDFGDGETSAEPAPVHRYEAPGTYEAAVEITYADGERRRRELEVEVEPPRLALTVSKVRRFRATDVVARVRNAGAGASDAIELCARPVRGRARVRAPRCRTLAPLAPGAWRSVRFRVRVVRGGYARVRVSAATAWTGPARAGVRVSR